MSSELVVLHKQLEFMTNMVDDLRYEIINGIESQYVGKFIRPTTSKEQMTTYYIMHNRLMPDFDSAIKLDYSEHKYLVVDSELEFDGKRYVMTVKIRLEKKAIWLSVNNIEIVE